MREYPAAPLVGVGAVIVDGARVLLVRRGRPPALGKWSLPGGLVQVGESVEAAAQREVAEECGLAVRLRGLVGYVDRIVRDAAGRVQYHYVLLDFLATPADGEAGTACAGSDADAVRWCTLPELVTLDVTEGVEAMIRRAFEMDAARARQP
ncbi:MAG: NUDIX hydrolase [Candidatus Rokubacteria bacterium]|nr:NUDIX hydrolase [Candidatus Rokubacteria bacterium]